MSSKVKIYVLIILLNLIFIEILSFFVSKFFLANVGALFDKKKITQNYDEYLKKRDNILGWDTFIGKDNLDKYSARVDRSTFKNSKPCVDLYGDSFTYGHDNEDFSWPSQLSELIECRVRNFGVGGYGSDQAQMKFLSKTNHSDIVFLNHFSENIIRNINQFRNFIYPNKSFVFKPRYIIKNDELELVPLPQIQKKNINDFFLQPEKYLSEEYFLPGYESGIQKLKFPFTLNVLKSFNHWHIRKKISQNPSRLVDFYSPNHKSKALQITFKIMHSFYLEAEYLGLKPVLTVFPTCRDLEYFQKYKKYPYENLINLLEQKNLRYINFGPIIMKKSKNNFKILYDRCGGHFNIEGETLVSKVIQEYIFETNLLEK